jgi:hypothetical protein
MAAKGDRGLALASVAFEITGGVLSPPSFLSSAVVGGGDSQPVSRPVVATIKPTVNMIERRMFVNLLMRKPEWRPLIRVSIFNDRGRQSQYSP